jgi:signal transduction histidine kinase
MTLKSRYYVLVLVLSISFGFINYFTPFYMKLLNAESFKIVGSLNQFKTNCESHSKELTCFYKYRIDISQLREYEYLGLGFFPRKPVIYCDNNKAKINSHLKVNNSLFDSINIYQEFNYSNCERIVTIEIWDAADTIRKGPQTEKVIAGSEEVVYLMKQLSETLSRYFYLIILFSIVPFFIFFRFLIRNHIIRSNYPFLSSTIYWGIYLMFATGLIHYIIPINYDVIKYNRVVWFFSAIAHSFPLLSYLRFNSSRHILLVLFLVFILTSKLLFSYLFFTALIISYLFFSVQRRRGDFLVFSLCTMLALFKALNFTFSPSSRLSSITFFLLVLSELFLILKELNLDQNKLKTIFSSKESLSNINRKEIETLIHDLRAPIAVISNESQKLKSDSLILTSLDRLESIVSSFNIKSFKRIDKSQIEYLILEKEFLFKKEINFSVSFSEVLFFLDTNFLRILSNILDNSLESSTKESSFDLILSKTKNNYIFQIFNYSKIPFEILENLNNGIEFSTKVYGNGIGAKSAKEWIEKHNGSIQYKASGEVIIKLPLA